MSNDVIKTELNTDKSPARPSHEALNSEHASKLDKIADEAAQRAGNRERINDEGKQFSK